MANWTYKQWGAVIGFLLVFSSALIGVGPTALGILFAIIGYLIGAFLAGEIDLEQIRARAQGRYPGGRYPGERYPGGGGPPPRV